MVGLDLGMVVVGLDNLSVGLGVFSRLRGGNFEGMKGEANEWGKKKDWKCCNLQYWLFQKILVEVISLLPSPF